MLEVFVLHNVCAKGDDSGAVVFKENGVVLGKDDHGLDGFTTDLLVLLESEDDGVQHWLDNGGKVFDIVFVLHGGEER